MPGKHPFLSTLSDSKKNKTASIIDKYNPVTDVMILKGLQAGTGIDFIITDADPDSDLHEKKLIISATGGGSQPGPQGPQGPAGVNGKTVLNGTSDPTTQGTDGDFYLNTTTSKLFGPKTASNWGTGILLIGPQGSTGADGRTILNGTSNPTSVGNNGDFYINTTTSTLFGPKASGTWPAGVVLKGTNGTNGTDGKTVLNGTDAPELTAGVDGDFFIDTSTYNLYGPKAGDTWPGPVSLIGPQGLKGPAGVLDVLSTSITGSSSSQPFNITSGAVYVITATDPGGTNTIGMPGVADIGDQCIIKNTTPSSILIKPFSNDTIDGFGVGVNDILDGNSAKIYYRFDSNRWMSIQVADPKITINTTVQPTGTDAASAALLLPHFAYIITTVSASDNALKMAPAAGYTFNGTQCFVRNNGNQSIFVFPATGGTINGGAVDVADELVALDTRRYISDGNNNWYSF